MALVSPGSHWFGPVTKVCHSVRDWCESNGGRFIAGEEPHLFTAALPNGRVYGKRSLAVISNRDEFFTELSLLHSSWRKIQPVEEHRVFRQLLLPRRRKLKGTAAVLASPEGGTYFHWMFEALPGLEMLRRAGIARDSIDHFIVSGMSQRFQQVTLDHLKISARAVSLDKSPHLQADTLIASSVPVHAGQPCRWVLDFLRNTFLPMAEGIAAAPQRIYISRAKAKHRRLSNEAEVIRRLERIGFRPVHLEELSLPEQIALFRNAEAIVGVHGAGFVNLAFCSPGTKVLEIFTPGLKPQMYAHLSGQLGLSYVGLVPVAAGDLVHVPPELRDVTVTATELDSALERLG
ncbi:MAG TPA: glycosyltransferase family 61 protein [Candidatus Paceibacterota bacterium]|nr:glycosyltransferase family 61 protein [Candidatus Paceibacterota bacterium]